MRCHPGTTDRRTYWPTRAALLGVPHRDPTLSPCSLHLALAPGGVRRPVPQAGSPDPTAWRGAALPGRGPEVLGLLAGTCLRRPCDTPRTSRAVWLLLCSGEAFISNSRSHYSQCQDLLNKISSVNPQTEIDGLQNIWIVKPAAKSRGRGESRGQGASPGPAGRPLGAKQVG